MQNPRPRHRLLVAPIAAAVVASVLAGCGATVSPTAQSLDSPPVSSTTTVAAPSSSTTTVAAGTSTTRNPSTTTTVYTHAIVSPARIVIPAITVDAPVVSVGIDKDGGMEVPKVGVVGWYELGPAPGASGPSVMVAHVSYNGVHGAFYDLKKLKVGDQVLVYDSAGDYAVFQVDSKEITLKTELPTEKIWNETQDPLLRLITCGGRYDSQTQHYLSNVIVYGRLVR
jgi:LPXTG-site transpeptidase (sortase) family protein